MIVQVLAAISAIPKIMDGIFKLVEAIHLHIQAMEKQRMSNEHLAALAEAKKTGDTSALEKAWSFNRKP